METEKGFKEDNKYTDLKILVALIACVLGVVSHFYPIPFPKNKPLLIGCVVGYLICVTIYYLIEKNLEGDAFYRSGDHSLNALKDFPKVRLSSDLEATQRTCTYILRVQADAPNKGKKIDFEAKYDVTTMVDEFGHLHRYKVKEAFEETLNKVINSPK